MNYNIVASSSSGNCVTIEDLMFDCGVSYNKIEKYLKDIKVLFYTHSHRDHMKISTYQRIRKRYPHIKIIGNYDVSNYIDLDYICGTLSFDVAGRTFTPFDCVHNVPCTGYTWTQDGQNVIYATDTTTLKNAPDIKYDWFFIESNHDEKKLLAILNENGGVMTFNNSKRHLSTKESKTFYYMNRRNKESKWIELHKSSRFY